MKSALAKMALGGLALTLALVASPSGARADATQAKELFKKMSDYLGSQEKFAIDFDTNLQIVTKDNQKLSLASSATLNMQRPDKLRVTRRGGFADVELVYDGKTVTFFDKEHGKYVQAEAPDTVDKLIETIRDKYKRPVPAADLLSANVYDQIMPLVTDVKDLGSGVIRGEECDHIAFRTKEVDLELWITQGDQPRPMRYVITSSKMKGSPEYTIDVNKFMTGADVPAVEFSFTPPEGAKQVQFKELDFDELPKEFKTK